MDILDREEKPPPARGIVPGFIGAVAYVLATLACLLGLYAYWTGYSAAAEAGAPDAMRLAGSVMLAFYARVGSIVMLSLGLIFHLYSFHQFEFHPKWLWTIVLITGLVVLISGIFPFSPLFLILGVVLLIHALSKKEAYDDDGAVE